MTKVLAFKFLLLYIVTPRPVAIDLDFHNNGTISFFAVRPGPKPGMHKKDTVPNSQMHHDMSKMQKTDTVPKDHMHHDMQMNDSNMNDHSHGMHDMNMPMGNMSHSFSLNLPMSRNGSGTGWSPDAAPMEGTMHHSKNWMYMLHYNLFMRYNKQDLTNKGSRGDAMVDAPNWLMFMGQRKVGEHGLFRFGTMFSLDAIITGQRGYPLLFQSGESAHGEPLVDRQHPHDLFSELSVTYSHSFSKKSGCVRLRRLPGRACARAGCIHAPGICIVQS